MFKYGDQIFIKEEPYPIGGEFWDGQIGIVIDIKTSFIEAQDSNRYLFEYLIKLKHTEKWFIETNIRRFTND